MKKRGGIPHCCLLHWLLSQFFSLKIRNQRENLNACTFAFSIGSVFWSYHMTPVHEENLYLKWPAKNHRRNDKIKKESPFFKVQWNYVFRRGLQIDFKTITQSVD